MTEPESVQDPWANASAPEAVKPPPPTGKKRNPRRTVVVESPLGSDQIIVLTNQDGGVRGVYRRKWLQLEDDEEPENPVRQRPIDVLILDCGLEIEYVVDTPEGKVIHCAVVKGTAIERQTMAAEVLEDNKKLNAWGTRVALANWNIDDDFTRRLLKSWLLQQPGARRVVYCPGYSGYDAERGVWLTDGCAIGSDGRAHMNTSGVSTGAISCSDGQPREFLVPTGGPHVRPFGLPIDSDWAFKVPESRVVMKELCNALHANLGHHGGAIGLGWLVAGLVRDRMHAEHASFPVLYLHGSRHSGKNTLGEVLMRVVGQPGMPIKAGRGSATLVGLRDVAANCANVPMWFDELRNDDVCEQYIPFVRGMFDGSVSVTGNKDRSGHPRIFVPRRTLMCSGQSLLGKDAEHSRYVVVELTKHSINREMYPPVQSSLGRAHQAFWRIAATRSQWVDDALWTVAHYDRVLRARTEGHHVMDRQLYSWAAVCAGLALGTIYDTMHTIGMASVAGQADPLGDDFLNEVVTRLLHSQEIRNEDSAVQSFWSVAETMHSQGRASADLWCRGIVSRDGEVTIALWIDFLVNIVQREGKLGSAVEKRLLYTELSSEDGWVAHSHNTLIGDVPRRCSIFKLDAPCVPAWIKKIVIDKLPSFAQVIARKQIGDQIGLPLTEPQP